MVIFVLLVTFELISHYPNIDSSHWLRKYVQLITDKFFREMRMIQMALTLSSLTFLLNFWFLPVFVVVFIVVSFIVMSY